MVMGHRGGCFLCERMFTLLDISSHVRISAESADIAGTVHVAAAYLGARSVAGRNTRALVVALRRVSASARRLPALLLSAPQHQAARNWNGHMSCHHLHCLHPHSDLAHRYWAALLQSGSTIVDATAGNGHDACFLAAALGRAGGGTLVLIDLQALALERSRARLRSALEHEGWVISTSGAAWHARQRESGAKLAIRWLHGDHASHLEKMMTSSAALVVFNLGYLPGADMTCHGMTRHISDLPRLPSGCPHHMHTYHNITWHNMT